MNEKIERYLKYIPISGAITYLFGYLILSTRLSSLNIFVKDFLSLDYLKTGILFIVFVSLLALICFEMRVTKNRFLRFFLSIGFQAGLILLISPVVFESGMKFNLSIGLGTFLLFPILVYLVFILSVKISNKISELNTYNYAILIVLFIIMISCFANLIFPQIQFRFGGGAPYSKTIYLKDDNSTEKFDVRVYYENDKWIHYLSKEEKIISLPKKNIEKEESILNESFLNLDFNR